MRKTVLTILLVLSAGLVTAQKPYSVRMAESQASSLLQENWDPASGMVAHALISLAAQYPEEKALYELAKGYADKQLDESGNIRDFQKGVLENFIPGKALLDLYQQEEEAQKEKYKKSADWLHSYLVMTYPRIKKNTGKTAFIHEDSYPNQMWAQDLYDGCSFYAQWLGLRDLSNKAAWTDVAVQLLIYQKQAFNTIWALPHPHWSVDPGNENSFWATREGIYTGVSKVYTGQATGYLLAALVDVMEYLPKNQAGYKQVKDFLLQVAEGVQNWQDDATGCWHQLIHFNTAKSGECGTSNYLESSASCLMAYGLQKGIRLGLLDKATYENSAQKAYEGIISQFVGEADGKLTLKNCTGYIGVGNGADMARDGSIDYYLCGEGVQARENDPKAVAAFILACLEHERNN